MEFNTIMHSQSTAGSVSPAKLEGWSSWKCGVRGQWERGVVGEGGDGRGWQVRAFAFKSKAGQAINPASDLKSAGQRQHLSGPEK